MNYQIMDGGVLRDATPEDEAELRALASTQPQAIERAITKLAFRNRFTMAEKTAIELAALDAPAAPTEQRQLAAGVRVHLADLNAAAFVALDHEGTRAGVEMLEAIEIIGIGRAAEILDAEIQADERFYA